jgi:glycosyltransferase involved in cell wall biosynthesis
MQKLRTRISIVIPVYNEQDHLKACLEAIATQTQKPFEVLVIDNNSTDKTAEVANSFPFVTVLQQAKQGVIHARSLGYDSARGEIIGRIDADTILPTDWTSKLQAIFEDKSVQAVSGGIHFYDIGFNLTIDGIDAYWRAWMARRMAKNQRVFLMGSNMGIRRSAWVEVRDHLCGAGKMHEDLDLALHLSEIKRKVVFDSDLWVNMSARRIDTGLIALCYYSFLSPLTYMKHNAKEHRYMYPLIAVVLSNYVILRLLFRFFDGETNRYSLRHVFVSEARVNPATYI